MREESPDSIDAWCRFITFENQDMLKLLVILKATLVSSNHSNHHREKYVIIVAVVPDNCGPAEMSQGQCC